jgi:GTP-binding protein
LARPRRHARLQRDCKGAIAQEPARTTEAENVTRTPRRSVSDARIDEFEIEADLAIARTWRVTGAAIERFAAMTNWDYYEAAARFQKVLDVSGERPREAQRGLERARRVRAGRGGPRSARAARAGISRSLRARGVREGDSVVVGAAELVWSDNQSAGALYEAWREGRREKGNGLQGSSRWPHAT